MKAGPLGCHDAHVVVVVLLLQVQATLIMDQKKKAPALIAARDRRDWDENKEPELWMGRYTGVRPAWEIDDPEEFL